MKYTLAFTNLQKRCHSQSETSFAIEASRGCVAKPQPRRAENLVSHCVPKNWQILRVAVLNWEDDPGSLVMSL